MSFYDDMRFEEILAVREKTAHFSHHIRTRGLNIWQLAFILGLIEELLESLPSVPPKGKTIPVLKFYKGGAMADPIVHQTFNNLKTQVNTISTLPSGDPDPDAKVELISSDPSQVGVEVNPDGGFFLTTPLDSGSATITSKTTSPNATYEEFTIQFSYAPPPVGHTVAVIGADVSDL